MRRAAAGLLASGLLLAACGEPPVPRADADRRLLLIAIDGAGWDRMLPLLRAGELPHLESLVRRGYSARLTTMAPALSPVIWTTIATGKIPAKHGIRGFVVAHPGTGEQLPVTSNMRRVSAVWDMLGAAGVPVGVVGWWVTWPAEPVNGWMISPYAAPGQTTWKGSVYADGRAQQTWPPEYIEAMAPLIESGVDAARREFRRLFPVPDDMPRPEWLDAYLRDTLWVHVSDTIFRDLAEKTLRDHRPRFLAAYIGGVDVTGHRFWRFAHPETGDWASTPEQRQVLGGALADYYRWTDDAVGRLLDAAPEGTTVMVVSDHGMEAASERQRPATEWNLFPQEISGGHTEGPDGILLVAGPGTARNFDPGWWEDGTALPRLGEARHPAVLDVTPTILQLFGLPPGEDMDGRALPQVLAGETGGGPLPPLASWDSFAKRPDPGPIRSPRMEEVKRRLESLGYIGGD